MGKSLLLLLKSTSVLTLILLCVFAFGLLSFVVCTFAYSAFGIAGFVISIIGLFLAMHAVTEHYLY
jgi:hypothetical protein